LDKQPFTTPKQQGTQHLDAQYDPRQRNENLKESSHQLKDSVFFLTLKLKAVFSNQPIYNTLAKQVRYIFLPDYVKGSSAGKKKVTKRD